MAHLDEVNPYEIYTIEQLMERYGITINIKQRDNWRILFPNVGELIGFPNFGNVMIMATNGILAYYHVDHSGQLFLGHLRAFTGPIAKEYVDEDDWDFEKRRHKVNVYKRADGTYAIIPKDSFWDAYWEKHERMTHELHQLYCEIGRSIHADQFDNEYEKLCVRAQNVPKRNGRGFKTRRQILLEQI